MDMPESLLSKGISIVNTYLLNAIHEQFAYSSGKWMLMLDTTEKLAFKGSIMYQYPFA